MRCDRFFVADLFRMIPRNSLKMNAQGFFYRLNEKLSGVARRFATSAFSALLGLSFFSKSLCHPTYREAQAVYAQADATPDKKGEQDDLKPFSS